MHRNEIINAVKFIICDIIDDEVEVNDATVFNDIPGWDSLHAILFLAAIEGEFHFHFTIHETEHLRTISELVDIIEMKTR